MEQATFLVMRLMEDLLVDIRQAATPGLKKPIPMR